MLFVEIIIGGILAFVLGFVLERMKAERFKRFAAGSLIIAALIYVGFAAVGASFQTATYNWLIVELLGVLIYTFFAYAGVKISFWFLVIGWIAHVLWDVGLHFGEDIRFVPEFYPPVCIGFDIVFGLYIAYKFKFSDS